MTENRIKAHPILIDDSVADIPFYWQDQTFLAKEGEMISSALIANGISIFGHHPLTTPPRGFFAQRAVLAVHGDCGWTTFKACMTPVKSGCRFFL
jgi:hypothetical protein